MAVLKDLIVHGPSRFINTAYFKTLKADNLAADGGVFNKLIATNADIGTLDVDDLTAQNATVVGLLDVKGDLHTNRWTNANIANIGGSFYISPTVNCEITFGETPMSIIIEGSIGNRSIRVSNGNFATDTIQIYKTQYQNTEDDTPQKNKKYYYLNNEEYVLFEGENFEQNVTYYELIGSTSELDWKVGSRVIITGNIRLNTDGIDYPLGTCTGFLNAALESTGFTIANIDSPALETIINTLGTSNLKSYNISISMIEVGPRDSLKPVGIMMTSYGINGSTYIDIYGGVNSKTSLTGYADPNVRIGYLGDITAYEDTVGDLHTPTGWGIYTDNGYFRGVMVADSGSIGGFKIGNYELYSNDKTDVKSIEKGTYIGPSGFNISNGNIENTTFFTEDEVSIGGVLNWSAASGGNSSNLTIKADEIIIGQDNNNNDFKVKSLLTDAIEINQQQDQEINNLINITNVLEDYDKFITAVVNGNNPYIDFQYKTTDYKPKIKITTNSISFSLDEEENIITQITKINNDSLMHTTFGEFENLRMRAGGQGNLTWIARDNGHLSLKVVE